jgi:hypothetical protein
MGARGPQHLHLDFDFRAAFADNTIREIIRGPRCDEDFLRAEFHRQGVDLLTPAPGLDAALRRGRS